MQNTLLVGQQRAGDGQQVIARAGNQGEMIASQLHARYFEANMRGNLFTFGISNTALVAANAIATGLTATAQPVIGLWNPMGSGVWLSVLRVVLRETTLANSAVAPGGFAWVYSAGNSQITTGSNPINTRDLAVIGSSKAKGFAVSTALTGLTNNLAFLTASPLGGLNAAGPATAVPQPGGPGMVEVDGAIMVPPGGVAAIMNQVSTTTVSVSVGIVWEEVPILA